MPNFVELLTQSGKMAQGLILASLTLVTISFLTGLRRWYVISAMSRDNQEFLAYFWGGSSLEEAFAFAKTFTRPSLATIYLGSMDEWKRLRPQLQQRRRIAHHVAMIPVCRRLQPGMLTLKIIGSFTSSFVGLFTAACSIFATGQFDTLVNSIQLQAPFAMQAIVVALGIASAGAISATVLHEKFKFDIDEILKDISAFDTVFQDIIQVAQGHNRGAVS